MLHDVGGSSFSGKCKAPELGYAHARRNFMPFFYTVLLYRSFIPCIATLDRYLPPNLKRRSLSSLSSVSYARRSRLDDPGAVKTTQHFSGSSTSIMDVRRQ